MNREHFKEEFSKFLLQFSAPAKDESNLPLTPLTKQEIFDSVQEVLDSKLDVTLVDSTRDDIRTPASGIVTTTPDAPDIPKIIVKQNGDISERFQSFDSLVTECLTNSSNDQLSLLDLDLLAPNVEENNNGFEVDVPDTRLEERQVDKYNGVSKSSATVSKLVRSDTFVREDEFQSVKNGDVFEEKKIDSIVTEGFGSDDSLPGINLINVFMKLKTLKDSATDVINKIDDIKKVVPDNIRPIRRLSSMGCFPGLNRTSKLTRRSLASFPGTPTSSRLSSDTPGTSDSAAVRSNSTATISLAKNGGSKLSIPSTYRSVSLGALTLPKNMSLPHGSQCSGIKAQKTLGLRSPSTSLVKLSDRSFNRQTTNPKYPRVQSNTGKSGIALGKRKAN